MDVAAEAASRIGAARATLRDVGASSTGWRYPPEPERHTADRSSYEAAVSMPDAPRALAMLQTYAEFVDLDQDSTWSCSALPSTSRQTRFSTINTANRELFYVLIEPGAGEVTGWGLRVLEDAAIPVGFATQLLDADVRLLGESLEDLLTLLADPVGGESVRAMRAARHWPRRGEWHNPWLAALVCPGQSTLDASERLYQPLDDEAEIERRYYEYVARSRGHQRQFRERLLQHDDNECAYCGVDVVEVLDAAHIIADSQGGRAHPDNGRLLCANHHRAFDAGLLQWTGTRFIQADSAPIVPPLPDARS